LADEGDAFGESTALGGKDAEEVKGIGGIRVLGEDLMIEFFRFIQAIGLLELHRFHERLLKRVGLHWADYSQKN
jgi:hypothetical protein